MAGGTIVVTQYIYNLLSLSNVFVIFTKFGCDLLHHLSHLTVKYLLCIAHLSTCLEFNVLANC